MYRSNRLLWLARAALAATLAAVAVACSDFGGSSVVPCDDGAAGTTEEVAATGTQDAPGGGPADQSLGDARSEGAVFDSAGMLPGADSGSGDSGPVGTLEASEVGSLDSTLGVTPADTAPPGLGLDATVADAIVEVGSGNAGQDSTVADADAGQDITVADAGAGDAGGLPVDAQDSGTADSGSDANSILDSAGGDTEAAPAGDGGETPCTASSSPPTCRQCTGSVGGICTATEAVLTAYDIAHGLPATSGCYACLVKNACLDSIKHLPLQAGAKSVECGDPNPLVSSPPLNPSNGSAANVPACLDALDCVLNSNHCSTTLPPASTDPNASTENCFCGTSGASCTTPGAANGPCANRLPTDLSLAVTTTAQITAFLGAYTDPNNPGGVGTQIVNCALTATCDVCFR